MLRALIAKDLRRAWRNPIPWAINLALPLCITALIGLIFGGNNESGLSRIRFAVVDEDASVITRMLRGAMGQDRGGKYLEPVVLERAEALRQIKANQLSAALVIPTNFTRNYLTGTGDVKIELVKNPAESIHPAVLEELTATVVTTLNAVARNFQADFPAWRAALEGNFDYKRVSGLVDSAGRKLEMAGKFVKPPLVVYETVTSQTGPTTGTNEKTSTAKPRSNQAAAIFAYLLPGLSAMFLLFMAGNAVSDLLRELRFRTFERYQTIREALFPFVFGKLLFALVMLGIAGAILLGGGGLIFHVRWTHPLPLAVLTLAYAAFATALMGLFVALMPDERRAGALTNIAGMLLAMAGGCMFPREQLPRFLGEHVTPLLPSAWFVDAARALQFDGSVSLPWVLAKLSVLTAVLMAGGVLVFRRRFRAGAVA